MAKQGRGWSRVMEVLGDASGAGSAGWSSALAAELEKLRPRTPGALHGFVRSGLGMDVPRVAWRAGGRPPFDYLCHAFFERGDCVVWACRGGGKTALGAAATMLDMLFKPGIEVRILGGSLEQSSKMYEHLRRLSAMPLIRPLLAGEPTRRSIRLVNGSRTDLLAQTHKSVRGTRVHRLRCDEVDEFDARVWEAAQLVTRSGPAGAVAVAGAVEALSTMHRAYGVMSTLVGDASRPGAPAPGGTGAPAPGAPGGAALFRWTAMDVIERCPPERSCDGCPLWEDCGGSARAATGFVRIEDLIRQKSRISRDAWRSEMMCERPASRAAVYARFDASPGGPHVHEPDADRPGDRHVAGVDFGIRSPFVMLLARVRREPANEAGGVPAWRVHVVDEYVASDRTLEENARLAAARGWPSVDWCGVDPAGEQRNAQTGLSDTAVLRRLGARVRARRTTIAQGVERVRARLDHRTLAIAPRCARLIRAMAEYHFDESRPSSDDPVKDGPDHLCDALRYLVMNLEGEGSCRVKEAGY